MRDLISRQAAIDALVGVTMFKTKHEIMQRVNASVQDEQGWLGAVAECLDEIEDLPSAQPKKRTEKRTETHSCDCIDQIDREPTIEPRCEAREAFNKTRLLIPQPERKKGHWIRHPEQRNIFNGKTIECSECHEKYTVQYVEDEWFCRHCGADMREPEDIPMEYFESGGR